MKTVKTFGQFSPIKSWDYPQGEGTKATRPHKLSKAGKKRLKRLMRDWHMTPVPKRKEVA